MKAIIASLTFVAATGSSIGQGTLSFENTSSTLISANEVSMPVSGTQQFFFALFLATGTSMNAPGQTAALTDPSFQIVAAYNTNSSVGPGRITPRGDLTVGESQGFFPSSTVDFIVRGWSANAGTTWTEALANWNNGSPLVPMFIGSSTVGKGTNVKTIAVFLVTLCNVICSLAQGTVTFRNDTTTLIQTNAAGLGGTIGVTATNAGGFYYAVFTAEPTVTSATLSDLATTNWTFTGLYGSNIQSQPGGRLYGGVNVTVPTGWPPWVTKSFVVAGWSGNIAGKDWAVVRTQLEGVALANGVWFGSNWATGSYGGFIGLSVVGNGQSIYSDFPSPSIFGLGTNTFFTPVPGVDLFVVAGPESPRITKQPTSQVAAAGSYITFNVTTYGWQPRYQWQHDGVAIPGATDATLNLRVRATDAGVYTVVISNIFGSVISSNDKLVVLMPPILTATGTGGGTVSLDPPPGSYTSNSIVTVTAMPESGWRFLEWLGDLSGTNPVESIWLNQDKTVHAVFGTSLNATNGGGGEIAIDPGSEFYAYGSTVQLVAIPNSGYAFSSWSGVASGNTNPLYLTITNANSTIGASFGRIILGPLLQASLTVIPIGFGRVSANPRLNIGDWGQTTLLTATPDPGQQFVGWSGGEMGSSNPISVYFNNQTVIANFTARPNLTAQTDLADVAATFRILLTGRYPASYEFFASSNLIDWYSLGLITNQYGTCQFDDNAVTNSGARVYRALIK